MAEAIFRRSLSKADSVRSAGTSAAPGSPRSKNALAALKEIGASVSGIAALVDDALIDWADLILCMEDHHRDAILMRWDIDRDKVRLLTEWADPEGRTDFAGAGVSDPFGGSLEDYRAVRDELVTLIRMGLDDRE